MNFGELEEDLYQSDLGEHLRVDYSRPTSHFRPPFFPLQPLLMYLPPFPDPGYTRGAIGKGGAAAGGGIRAAQVDERTKVRGTELPDAAELDLVT